jgi:uncharacterized protein
MYPFASLPENLVAFCRELRGTHGFVAGAREMFDAARALTLVDLGDERRVRDTLRPILSSSVEEIGRFDDAFSRFFLPAVRAIRQAEQAAATRQRLAETNPASGDERTGAQSGPPTPADAPQDESEHDSRASVEAIDARDGGDEARGLLRSSYSPVDVESTRGPLVVPAEAAWRAAARAFVRRFHLGASRRWRPGRRGRRFDLRRTLRASLPTGGEPLSPRWLRRGQRTPRFVLLVDGSRSMTAYWGPSLELAVAMSAATPRIEVFVFSTTIERVTSEIRQASAGDRRRLADLRSAWGGGTSIGSAIGALVRRSARGLLGRSTIVIIVSDGLDVGRPEVLRDVMRDLQRRSASVIWLNPLAGTIGYRPTAAAMRAALPFVSSFASVTTPADLQQLSRVVRVKRALA